MTDIDGKAEWKTCIDVSGIKLPTGYFFGISSATGELAGVVYSPLLLLSVILLGVACHWI